MMLDPWCVEDAAGERHEEITPTGERHDGVPPTRPSPTRGEGVFDFPVPLWGYFSAPLWGRARVGGAGRGQQRYANVTRSRNRQRRNVEVRGGWQGRCGMDATFPPVRAWVPASVGPQRAALGRRSASGPPGCSWPKHRNRSSTGRSSGLRLVSDPGPPSRLAGGSGLSPGTWPITAAAPRRIRTVFPILPFAQLGLRAPVEWND